MSACGLRSAESHVRGSGLSERAERMLSVRIHSLGELEVLLLLHRERERWWTAAQVNEALRSSLYAAQLALAHLHAAQLLEAASSDPPAFRFAPRDPEDAATVSELDTVFRDRPSSIIDAVYGPKHESLRDFAESFRIRKKSE